jgi:hypothetical protein
MGDTVSPPAVERTRVGGVMREEGRLNSPLSREGVELFRVPRVSDVLLVLTESRLECTSARPALLAVMPHPQQVHSAPIAGLVLTPLWGPQFALSVQQARILR